MDKTINVFDVPAGVHHLEWFAKVSQAFADSFTLGSKAKHMLWELQHQVFLEHGAVNVQQLLESLSVRKSDLKNSREGSPEHHHTTEAIRELQQALTRYEIEMSKPGEHRHDDVSEHLIRLQSAS